MSKFRVFTTCLVLFTIVTLIGTGCVRRHEGTQQQTTMNQQTAPFGQPGTQQQQTQGVQQQQTPGAQQQTQGNQTQPGQTTGTGR